jgi:uncharacterized protein
MFLNTALPLDDEECSECVWLPLCVGGCPNKRLFVERRCIGFKEHPEAYALALHDRLANERDTWSKE